MIIKSNINRRKIENKLISVGNGSVKFVSFARNLGVTIDAAMSFKPKTANLVKLCRFYIHELMKIQKYLTVDTTK